MAALLPSTEDLPPVLASFYALGAARNGWLAHGSRPGEAGQDRDALAAAGLDVDCLEAEGRLSIEELDLTLAPETWVDGWSETLDERLAAGFDAVWFGRFAIGPTDREVQEVIPFEEAWMRRFRDRPMVTLCLYIIGGERTHWHSDDVGSVHDHLLNLRAG
jgi:hypothetical protein